jgi:hypothetical protein
MLPTLERTMDKGLLRMIRHAGKMLKAICATSSRTIPARKYLNPK